MKKITLLILMLFLSLAGYSQVTENFDSGTALPAGWVSVHNGAGSSVPEATKSWKIANTLPGGVTAASVPNFAYSERYSIGQGNTSTNWLITARIQVPLNGQIQFNTRQYSSGIQPGTEYQIKVSKTSQDTLTFNNVLVFGEDEIDDGGTNWEQKTIALNTTTYPQGSFIWVAFVRKQTQTDLSPNADRYWLIDDVRVNSRCATPLPNFVPNSTGLTSSIFTWSNPQGATKWEVVIGYAGQTLQEAIDDPTLFGVIVKDDGVPQLNLATTVPQVVLTPDTEYKYFVRAICSEDNKSEWSDAAFFKTKALGETCADPIVIPRIPFSTNGNTADSADTTDVAQGASCNVTGNYMAGNDRFYTFTAPITGEIRIRMSPTSPNSSIFVYRSCATVGVTCLAGVGNTNSNTRLIPALQVVGGETYIIVLSSSATTQTYSYYLELQYVSCNEPTDLNATAPTRTTVNLSWNNPFPANQWEYAVQTAGSQIPAGAGVLVGNDTDPTVTSYSVNGVTTDLAGNPIVGSTRYQFWVRSKCDPLAEAMSPWAGPFEFVTPICEPTTGNICDHPFILRGSGGWNGAVMHVVQNGIVVKVLGPEFTSGTSLTVQVPLCNGIPFSLFWVTGGTSPQTVAITVNNSFGQQLFIKNANNVDIPDPQIPMFTEMVDCLFPKCLPPTNVVSNGTATITANSIGIRWTPAAGTSEWEVDWRVLGEGTAPSEDQPIDPTRLTTTVPIAAAPYIATGLRSDTQYVFYVRAVCGNDRKSNWVSHANPFRTIESCKFPTSPVVLTTQRNAASFSWTQGAISGIPAPTQWEVVVKEPDGVMPAYDRAISNPRLLNIGELYTGLDSGTRYEYWVRSYCSPTDVSRWMKSPVFNTLCDPLEVPYSQEFNTTSDRTFCWTVINGGGNNAWTLNYATTPIEGNQSASFGPNNGTNNDDWLVSPTLNLLTNYRMRFKYKMQSATAANSIEIKLSTNGGSAVADFTETLMPARTFNNTQAQEMIIYLADYAGMPINVGWHVVNGVNNSNRIYIDEVVFEPIPACPVPTFPIVVAGSITSTSATLSWDAGYQETQWQVVVQPQGTGVPAAGITGLLTSTNQNLLVNRDYLNQPLQPGTPYEYYVRAYCSDTNQSEWVGPVRFKTLLCEEADKCEFTFTMTDTGRNRWQSTMSIIQNGEIVATLSGPASGQLTANQLVRLCPGVQYSVFWNTGTGTVADAAQVGLSITNPYSDVVYTKAPGSGFTNTTIYRGMPFCGPISCPYPTNLQVAQTSGSSVQLTWTPGGTETQWQYVLQQEGGPYPGNTPGTTVNQPLANEFGVPSSTPMEFYVRAVCGPDDLSYWVGPIPFTIFNSPGCIGVDIVDVPISAGHEELVCPNDPCVSLDATYYQTKQTTTYEVQSIPYLPPFAFDSPTANKIPITQDDDWSPLIDLTALADGTGGSKPFNFCFFGNVYNKLLITDNGAITFSIAGVTTPGYYTAGSANSGYELYANQTIPYFPNGTTTLPYRNSISGVLQDLDPATSPPDHSINYTVLGTAPCRAFVMNINKLQLWGSACAGQPLQTSQIVLYEGSNIIDVYVENRTSCSGWNRGLGVIGIQNENATAWAVPPGRNTGTWNATREAWRFMPNGANENIIFEWRENGNPISTNLALNYCLPDGVDSVLLEAVATYPRCGGPNEERKSEVKVIRNKLPIEDPKDLKACAGVSTNFDLTENNPVILDGITNTGDYQITYYLTLSEAQTGAGGEITSYTTAVTTPIFVRILNTVTTCWETRTFNLVPDSPLPDYTLDTFDGDAVICTGESTTIVVTPVNFAIADATYEWSLPDGTILSETSNILTIPSGTAEGVYTYLVTVNDGCETVKSYTLTVTNDDPVVAFHYDTPVCIAATANPVAIPDGAPLTTGTGIQFTVPAGSPLVFANATTGEIDLTQTPAGVYQITYEVPATSCTALGTHSFEITINDGAPAITGFRYDNPTVCVNGSVTPTLVTDTGFTTGGTFAFATPGTTGLTLNPSTGAITIDATTVPGVYDIVYNVLIDPTNCIAAGTSPIVTVTINSGFDADANFTYQETSYCVNSPAVTPNFVSTPGGRFSATPSGLNINVVTGEITIAGSTVGQYRIQYEITDDTATCLKGDVKFFDITIEPEIDVTIADNCENGNYVLHATPDDSSFTYTWKDASGATVGTNSPTFDVTRHVTDGQVYPTKFTVTVNNGCDTTEEFTVQSIACQIPKGISPNGDGENDEFDLTGFNVRKLEIFNRYGMKVNSFRNYVKEWRGQSDSGNDLPDGTYYYVIEREGVKTVTGWVQINRQRN